MQRPARRHEQCSVTVVSDRDREFDWRMRVVSFEFEVIDRVVEQGGSLSLDPERSAKVGVFSTVAPSPVRRD